MKILYIGECDSLSSQLIDRHVKEGNAISIISQHDFPKSIKPKLEYTWYNNHADNVNIDRIFNNVKPQQVVFAGSLFGHKEWTYGATSNRYISELLNILNLSKKYTVEKFILLSSTEIHKELKNEDVTEDSELGASTYKGILTVQGENIATEFSSMSQLNLLILRFSDLYGYKLEENKGDFLSNYIRQFQNLNVVHINTEYCFSPLHLSDAVEALYRCEGNTPSKVYNVSGSQQISEVELATEIKKKLNSSASIISHQGNSQINKFDSTRIKSELEWSEFKDIKNVLENMQADSVGKDGLKPGQVTKEKTDSVILRLTENIVFFIVMAGLSFIFKDHSVLKNVDLMTVYIVSIALFFGIRQSILSIVLTFGFYLYGRQFDFGNIINIILNADTFLQLTQYIFMGVVVGYTVDQFKTNMAQTTIEKEYLENEYVELKEINDMNVMIKHQYEKRLISYKTSLPRLYAITNQLDSLDPEILFSSIIKVLVDVLETDTVSVYTFDTHSGYARLIAAKNEESVFMGRSFKLSDHKELEQKLLDNDVFVGNQWSEGSPAMAGPIFYKGDIIAIILVKSMAFESLNLYQVNLLRTLTSLISSSFIRAYQYEEKVHSEKYLANTEILTASEFLRLVELKQKDREQGLVEYTLLRLIHTEDPTSYYYKIMNLFRSTDYLGVDHNDRIHVLLRNTAAQEVAFVEARLKAKDIHFELIDMNAVH